MDRLLAALSILGAVLAPCGGPPPGLPLPSREPSRCVEYQRQRIASATELVVFGIEAVEQRLGEDFEHRIFAALVRDGKFAGRRQELTAHLLDTGARGEFETIDVRINDFQIAGKAYADIVIRTLISGTGGISATSDFVFQASAGRLRLVGIIRTASSARSGWSFMRQASSEVFAGRGGLVVVTRDRRAEGKDPDKPLTVHCVVSRKEYRIAGDRLIARKLSAIDTKTLPVLPRLKEWEAVPCRN